MAYNAPKTTTVISIPNISLTSTGVQTLFTTAARFYPMTLLFELTSVSAFVTVATLSFGSNGGSFNNILAASALTGVSSVNNILTFNLDLSVVSSIATSTAVGINVTVAAVASTYTGKFIITGVYD